MVQQTLAEAFDLMYINRKNIEFCTTTEMLDEHPGAEEMANNIVKRLAKKGGGPCTIRELVSKREIKHRHGDIRVAACVLMKLGAISAELDRHLFDLDCPVSTGLSVKHRDILIRIRSPHTSSDKHAADAM